MKNAKIRTAIFQSEVKHYQVAEAMGVADETFSRWLRHELPDDKQEEILAVIEKLKKEEGTEGLTGGGSSK